MDCWYLFCARFIILFCVVLVVLAESGDDNSNNRKVKKREVHRIVLKSSRKPRSQHHHHNNRHHSSSSKEHHSHGKNKGHHHKHGGRPHKGHKSEEQDRHNSHEYDSDERSRENFNDHSYENTKFHPLSHEEDASSFYGSQEDRSYEEKAPPRKHKSHHKSKPRRPPPISTASSSQPYFSQEVEETRIAPFRDQWVPLVSSETALFSPAQLPQLTPPSPPPPALIYNTRPEYEYRITKRPPRKEKLAHHQHRQQKSHSKIELTTSFPQKLPHPVFYETPDYPILGRPFPPNFHQHKVLESAPAGKELSSGSTAGVNTNGFFSPNLSHNNDKSPEFDDQPKIKDFTKNYEVHESRINDFKEHKPRLPFNILAPLIDATRTQQLLSEESKNKNVEITTPRSSEKQQQTTVRNDVRPTRNGRGRTRYG